MKSILQEKKNLWWSCWIFILFPSWMVAWAHSKTWSLFSNGLCPINFSAREINWWYISHSTNLSMIFIQWIQLMITTKTIMYILCICFHISLMTTTTWCLFFCMGCVYECLFPCYQVCSSTYWSPGLGYERCSCQWTQYTAIYLWQRANWNLPWLVRSF